MKAKYLIIASLVLAILTIGAVSASEDVTVDDAMATSDVTEDPIEEAPVDEVIGQSEDSEPLEDISPSDFNVKIKDSIDLDDEDQNVINYTAPEDAEGNVEVYVDYMEWPSHTDSITPGDNYTVSLYQLNIEEADTYHIEVRYVPSEGDSLTLAQKSLKVTETYDVEDFNPYWNGEVYGKFDDVFSIYSPTVGTLIVYVNEDKRFNATVDEYDSISVELSDLNITSNGVYTVSAEFIVDSSSQEVDLGQKSVDVDVDDWDADRYVEVRESVDIDDSDSMVASVRAQGDCLNGTVTVDIDGDTILTKGFTEDDSEYYLDITLDDLGLYNNITAGDHTVKVVYMMNGVDKHEVVKSVEFYTYDPGDNHIDISYPINVVNTDYPVVRIYDYDGYVNGQISVYIDGALKVTKNVAASQKEDEVEFTVADLNMNNAVGTHTVKAVYTKNAKTYQLQRSVNFYAESDYYSYDEISYGERAQYIINHLKGFKGTATLYKATGEDYDQKGAVYGSASFVDGVAIIYLTSLPEGQNHFILSVTGDGEDHRVTIEVLKNTPGISASVTPTTIETGNSVTLKLTGPKDLNQNFYVYIDGVVQAKALNFFNLGTISQSYKFTTTGTHAIKVFSSDGEDSAFYSNTFYATVKAKQTAKVTKIVAKKATFKAKKKVKRYTITLKSGKAAVKKVIVTLKVKGKTYKAKTNKKGKAVFKIKNLKKKGKYTAVIKFKGNANYKASTKKVKLIVKK